MRPVKILTILTFIHSLGHGFAHSTPRVNAFGLRAGFRLSTELGRRDETTVLDVRQDPTQKCGLQNGGTSCSSGFCCSQDGLCGTGRAFCDAPYCQYKYGPACDDNATPVGMNTLSVSRPALGSVEYGGAGVWECSKPGYVALTYDDGPYVYTSELLDILSRLKVPATFFLTGNNYGKHGMDNESTPYPGLIRRMVTDGHQIGSHTWSHQDLNKLSSAERSDQMVKNEMAFRNIMNFWPTYMRPPFDSCTTDSGCRSDMAALGYHIVEYTVDTYDFDNTTPQTYPLSQSNVSATFEGKNPATSEFVVYAHDTHALTVRNLTEWMINTIDNLGYKFATIGECLDDPKENWYRDPATGHGTVGVIKQLPSSSSGISSASRTVTSTDTGAMNTNGAIHSDSIPPVSSPTQANGSMPSSHGGWSMLSILLVLNFLMFG